MVQKKAKNNFSKDYNEAFKKIDDAIKGLANKVFYGYENKSLDYAYKSFAKFEYFNAIIGRQRIKKKLWFFLLILFPRLSIFLE